MSVAKRVVQRQKSVPVRSESHVRVRRRTGERYADVCIAERNRWGGPSVKVSGRISYQQKTPLAIFDIRPGLWNGVTAQCYIDNVLRPVVLPYMAAHPGMMFQQDNAWPHTGRITSQFLQQNNTDPLPWPSMSPDLCLIEHLWDQLGQRINPLPHPPRNVAELHQVVPAEWNALPQYKINTFIGSMRRCCVACVAANGGQTGYWLYPVCICEL